MKYFVLKSCPFCGEDAIISSENLCLGHGDFREFYFVYCSNCLAQSQIIWNENEDIAIKEAVELWNKRVD